MALLLDTHCHLDAPEFQSDLQEVVAHAKAVGVHGVLIPAVSVSDFQAVKELAHQVSSELPATCCTLGIHPIFTPQSELSHLKTLREAIRDALDDPRFVGIGEIGLDYFLPELDTHHQAQFFEGQLQLAQEFELPVILHVRRSQDAIVSALRKKEITGGIAHAFNGSFVQANHFLKLNFVLGFGGAMTHPRALQIRRLAKDLPDDAIVLETDAPDIPPVWLAQSNNRRNDSSHLPEIAAVLAELRGSLISQTQHRCAQNALRVLPRWAQLIHSLGL